MINRLSSLTAASILVLGLGACAPSGSGVDIPPGFDVLTPNAVKPGIDGRKARNLTRPPFGQKFIYAMEAGAIFPFETSIEFYLSPLEAGYEVDGSFLIALPSESLQEIAAAVTDATGEAPNLRGNNAVVSVSAWLDQNMRTTHSEVLQSQVVYEPHDCFLVVGECRSGQFSDEDGWIYVIVNTAEKDGRFYATTQLDPERSLGRDEYIEIAVYSSDRYGLMLDHRSLDLTDPEAEVEVTRRVQ